jgi:hypothetical protein
MLCYPVHSPAQVIIACRALELPIGAATPSVVLAALTAQQPQHQQQQQPAVMAQAPLRGPRLIYGACNKCRMHAPGTALPAARDQLWIRQSTVSRKDVDYTLHDIAVCLDTCAHFFQLLQPSNTMYIITASSRHYHAYNTRAGQHMHYASFLISQIVVIDRIGQHSLHR